MTVYDLVNPVLGGNINTSFQSKTPLEAAQSAWLHISQYFLNNVPKFAFTLKGGDGKLHHYMVNEKVDEHKTASYTISSLNVKLNASQISNFGKQVDSINGKINNDQQGGKKHHSHKHDVDDSSSSSSDEELEDAIRSLKYKAMTQSQPLYYFWYNPLMYNTVDLYVPTFIAPISPYVHINLNSAFLN